MAEHTDAPEREGSESSGWCARCGADIDAEGLGKCDQYPDCEVAPVGSISEKARGER